MYTAVDVNRRSTGFEQLAQEGAAITAKFGPRQAASSRAWAISSVSVSVWRGRVVGTRQV